MAYNEFEVAELVEQHLAERQFSPKVCQLVRDGLARLGYTACWFTPEARDAEWAEGLAKMPDTG